MFIGIAGSPIRLGGTVIGIRLPVTLLSLCLVTAPVCANGRRVLGINADVFTLTRREASHFAGLALKCVTQEYPNKLDHTINDASEVQSPRSLHPAFYGCLDWHSSVHGHWMLARLLRL